MSQCFFEEFKKKFELEDFLIKDFDNWLISLRPQQPTLGSLVITLNRPSEALSDLSTSETSELSDVYKYLEKLYKNTFAPDKINYLALMMIDNQVHFHVIPRYKSLVIFKNQVFEDLKWPLPHDLIAKEMNKDLKMELCLFLKEKGN